MGGGAAAGGDFDAVLAQSNQQGWRGLFKNGKVILITMFASLGGVLYGYNQGVFGQVQVMEGFVYRYPDTVSFNRCLRLELCADKQLLQYLDNNPQNKDPANLNPNFNGAQALALLTAILELGAFVGALMAGPLADMISRKVSRAATRVCHD